MIAKEIRRTIAGVTMSLLRSTETPPKGKGGEGKGGAGGGEEGDGAWSRESR